MSTLLSGMEDRETQRVLVLCASTARAQAVSAALERAGRNPEICPSLERVLERAPQREEVVLVDAGLLPLPNALPSGTAILALHPSPPRMDPLCSLDAGAHEYVCWSSGRAFPVDRLAAALRAAAGSADRVLATVSHELRAPIGGVIGLCDLLLATALDDEQRDLVETARLSAEALLALTEQIVDWARLRSGRVEIEPLSFTLRDLVEEVCTLLAPQAHAKGLDLNCHVPPDHPATIVADAARIRQILVNLVSNAIKYTRRGGVDVHAEVAIEGDAAELRLEVRDTGPGIPPEDQERLFRPFCQLGGGRRAVHGVGLGLAISARLAALLGGSIEIESAPGRGSTFGLRVPVTVAGVDPPSPCEPSLAGCHLLVVDPDPTARLICRTYLGAHGARIDDVADGPSALALLAEPELAQRYDLVIFDMLMPGLDGLELATLLRARSDLAAIPLLTLTSLIDAAQRAELERLGVARLAKPVRESGLLRAVCRLLDRPPPLRRAPPPPALPAPPEQCGARVLVADDDPVTQRLLRLRLTKLGCRVDVLGCGESALAAALRRRYDLLLLDGHLPGLSGAAVLSALRTRSGPNRAARIAIMSASGASPCPEADASFAKPIPVEALIALLPGRDSSSPNTGIDSASLAERLGIELSAAESAELLARFLADARQRCAELRERLARGELAGVADAGHLLRGACASVGAADLAQIARRLEAAAERAALSEARAWLGRLEAGLASGGRPPA